MKRNDAVQSTRVSILALVAAGLMLTVGAPRLTWTLEGTARGAAQGAYQVLVASSEQKLAKDRGDVWDSGLVRSDQTAHVVYGGRALR